MIKRRIVHRETDNDTNIYNYIDIHLVSNFTNLGVENIIDYYDLDDDDEEYITYIGNSRIDEFTQPGMSIESEDLYFEVGRIIYKNNHYMKIISINEDVQNDPFSYQPLYKYEIGQSLFEDSNGEMVISDENKISYEDIGGNKAIIMFLNKKKDRGEFAVRDEELIGLIDDIKIKNNVFIDRGITTVTDKRSMLAMNKTNDDLDKYGNGYFKIKEGKN